MVYLIVTASADDASGPNTEPSAEVPMKGKSKLAILLSGEVIIVLKGVNEHWQYAARSLVIGALCCVTIILAAMD